MMLIEKVALSTLSSNICIEDTYCNKETTEYILNYILSFSEPTRSLISVVRSKHIRKDRDGYYISNRYQVANLCSKGYTKLPMHIWNYNLSPWEYVLYLYLSSKCDEFGKCLPSLRKIKSDTGLSLSTISKQLGELQVKALIIIIMMFYAELILKRKTRTNEYRHVIVKAGSKTFDEFNTFLRVLFFTSMNLDKR